MLPLRLNRLARSAFFPILIASLWLAPQANAAIELLRCGAVICSGYARIRDAIDDPAALPGDVIEIAEGVYSGKVVIRDKDGLTLRPKRGHRVIIRSGLFFTDWAPHSGGEGFYTTTYTADVAVKGASSRSSANPAGDRRGSPRSSGTVALRGSSCAATYADRSFKLRFPHHRY
jgi:hypothetical protein